MSQYLLTVTTFLLLTRIDTTLSALQHFRYVGCYADADSGQRDLTGRDMMLSGLTVGVCSIQCQSSGYPYAGLRMAQRCLCGSSFGNLGASLACNSSCDYQYCGGYMANDVYYSLDNSIASSRSIGFHREPATFTDARASCIKNNGDLPRIDNQQLLNDIINNITTALKTSPTTNQSAVSLVWFGLRRRLIPGPFEWTDENSVPYDEHIADFDSFWSPTEKLVENCVALNLGTQLWQTVPCGEPLPYICLQLPTRNEDTTDGSIMSTAATQDDPSASGKYLALYIVLPMFFFCYGGSCIFYVTYKTWKACRRAGLSKRSAPRQQGPVPGTPLPPKSARPYYVHHTMDDGPGIADRNRLALSGFHPMSKSPQPAEPAARSPAPTVTIDNETSHDAAVNADATGANHRLELPPLQVGGTNDKAKLMPDSDLGGEAGSMSISEILRLKLAKKMANNAGN